MEFVLPDIGEGVAEGQIVNWLVKPGQAVSEDDPLLEVMTDKVTVEIPAPQAGTISALLAQEGEIVKVGQAIISFVDTTPSVNQPITMEPNPIGRFTDTPTTGFHDPVETPHPRKAFGFPSSIKHNTPEIPHGPNPLKETASRVLAAPATRRLGQLMGVDLHSLQGTGPKGRITQTDVRQAAQNLVVPDAHVAASLQTEQFSPKDLQPIQTSPVISAPVSTPSSPNNGVQEKPYRGLRKMIGDRLTQVQQTVPAFAYVEELDVTELMTLRRQLKTTAQERGFKLSILPFVLKAVAQALKIHPALNAELDEQGGVILEKEGIHLGLAVDTEQGLMVPVIHDADQYRVDGLAEIVQNLATKARNQQLSRMESTGSTFTVTSVGSIGGLLGIPILNPPEVGILGVNQVKEKPVVRDGQIVIGKVLNLSLSCDHRVVDGADAARFMNTVKEFLERPASLLL